ncbi:MAG: hypothetical protein M3O94_08875 [Actinomycetota bacterium]|nr:hypothetical protein [Actinomycetota bacterium]
MQSSHLGLSYSLLAGAAIGFALLAWVLIVNWPEWGLLLLCFEGLYVSVGWREIRRISEDRRNRDDG